MGVETDYSSAILDDSFRPSWTDSLAGPFAWDPARALLLQPPLA